LRGTIGRSADNDWVPPDPSRYVSAHHARVQFREGHFYLQDVSTNGIYVNDDMEPLGKRGSSGYRLANGDVLRMGDYHIVAALDIKKPDDDVVPAVPTSIQALRPLRRIGERDIGAPINLDELLLPSADPDPVLPVNAYGQAVDSGRVHALSRGPEALASAHAADASAPGGVPSRSSLPPSRSPSAWRGWRRRSAANRRMAR
jgi:predicted component of type VI protein secretion system